MAAPSEQTMLNYACFSQDAHVSVPVCFGPRGGKTTSVFWQRDLATPSTVVFLVLEILFFTFSVYFLFSICLRGF